MHNRTSKQRKAAERRRATYVQERLEREHVRVIRTIRRETAAEARRLSKNVIALPKRKARKPRR